MPLESGDEARWPGLSALIAQDGSGLDAAHTPSRRAAGANRRPLWDLAAAAGLPAWRTLAGLGRQIAIADLERGACLDAAALEGRNVLVQTTQQLPTVLALLELDGVARRIVLAPPDIASAHLDTVIAQGAIDAVIGDEHAAYAGLPVMTCNLDLDLALRPNRRSMSYDTEWVLFTSGTTGAPKLVSHSVPGLTGPIGPAAGGVLWSTFYDVRRYGGLQILLRALLGGGSMVLSDVAERTAAFLARAGDAGVTHISGTPSHWRRALISGQAARINPAYVRLSGEIADQAVLDRLHAAYPAARISHAFASTEAGVAFDVTDGMAGFPAAWVGAPGPAELRVAGGTLHIRSNRTAAGYLGAAQPLADADGFVDTGDIVTLAGDRYHFCGRVGGVINVGGQKVYPEEVESALNAHPAVLAARVGVRPSPITGALVVAEVVVDGPAGGDLRHAILAACRGQLAPHKVPAMLRIVPALDVLPSGKLARRNA